MLIATGEKPRRHGLRWQPGDKAVPSHPHCLPHTYSAYVGQEMRGAQGAQEGQGGPGAPHSQCQEVPEGQVGQAGPGCSLPWDPRTTANPSLPDPWGPQDSS